MSRRPAFDTGQAASNLTVSVKTQPEGGVTIKVRGNDHEGLEAKRTEWLSWSESLPKKPGTEIVETPDVTLSVAPQASAPAIAEPPQVQPTVAPPSQESTVWRGTKLAFGGCVVLPILLLIGLGGCAVLIAGMGGFEESPQEEPASEISSVTVRVSGSTGLRYSGNYGTADGGGRSVEGQLDGGYDDYQVPVKNGTFDFDMVTAFFQKIDQEGTLQVEILVDGQVVKAQQTSAQYGVVDVSYSPQTD
jgi:hypothetical protein